MSTRSIVTVVGGVIGAYFGYPQLGLTIGALVGSAVDPGKIQGPQINETGAQTSAEGVPRPVIWGTIDVAGNIIQKGESVKVTEEESQGKGGGPEVTTERLFRTFAIRICEGPIGALLRVWADNKLVYDMRSGSEMVAESNKWIANKVVYLGDETQTADPTLVSTVNADTPAYRGTAYIVFILEDLSERAGSISQYRFEVAKEVSTGAVGVIQQVSSNVDRITDIAADSDGNLLMLEDQVGSVPFSVDTPANSGSFDINKYSKDDISLLESTTILNLGDPSEGSDQRMGIIGISPVGFYFSNGDDGTNASNRLLLGGSAVAHLLDTFGFRSWGAESLNGQPVQYGGLVFMTDTHIYIGLSRSTTSWVHKWGLGAGSPDLNPQAFVINPQGATGGIAIHLSRQETMRIINRSSWTTIQEFDSDLVLQDTRTVPTVGVPWASTTNLWGFGFDEAKGFQAYIYNVATDVFIALFDLSGNLLSNQFVVTGLAAPSINKIIFTDENIWVMVRYVSYRIPAPQTHIGNGSSLGDIVSDIHDRCGIDAVRYDVSELTDEVAGFVCAGDYMGSDAINTLRQGYFFDKSEHDKQLWYPKRGGAVIETLTVDDLTEIPDTTKREQAIEVPKKLHLRYKHARSGYAAVKATSSSSSPDMLTTGEVSIDLPIVLDEDQAAQKADVMYKITRTEVYGETEITVPMDVGAKYVTGNTIGLSLRGQTTRQRIDRIDFSDWKLKLALKPDRQSAYTSNLTGVPIPDPELPPSTIVGDTELAILDIPSRIDSEDDLNYLVAVTGRLPPWFGARYQRSLDGGATYASVQDITTASVMGEITNSVADASEYFTDTTNTINVVLYRPGQSIDSITNTEFLSEGGAFALEKSDGSWEVMQYRDAEENSDGSFTLSTLHRGMLNSGTSSHSSGDRLVMLSRPSHIVAQSSWLNTDLTHRAISLGESADDTDNDVTDTYIGRSQIEWPVEFLQVEEDSSGSVSASWVPRFRFGTDANPVNSINMIGYRVTITSGSSSLIFDTTVPNFSAYDASSLGETKTVSVSALNRITGAGPATSKVV